MTKNKKITEEQLRDFKIWLMDNNLTVTKFAKKCGVCHQYVFKVLHGTNNITPAVIETFKKGGYELKE